MTALIATEKKRTFVCSKSIIENRKNTLWQTRCNLHFDED